MRVSQSTLTWVRAKRCESGNCVEIARVDDKIAVRNSTQPDGPVVTFTKAEWDAFVHGVVDGDFDLF